MGTGFIRLAPAIVIGFNAATLLYGIALAVSATWTTHTRWDPLTLRTDFDNRSFRVLFSLAFAVPSMLSLSGSWMRHGRRRVGAVLVALGGLLWFAHGHFVLLCCWGWSAFSWPWGWLPVAHVMLLEAPLILASLIHAVVATHWVRS